MCYIIYVYLCVYLETYLCSIEQKHFQRSYLWGQYGKC